MNVRKKCRLDLFMKIHAEKAIDLLFEEAVTKDFFFFIRLRLEQEVSQTANRILIKLLNVIYFSIFHHPSFISFTTGVILKGSVRLFKLSFMFYLFIFSQDTSLFIGV